MRKGARLPETEEQKSPGPYDRAGENSPTSNDGQVDDPDNKPYLNIPDDDLMITTDLE